MTETTTKTALVPAKNARGADTVRLSDEELHRRACKAIWEGNHVVFESLPSLVARIIEHKTWRTYHHKDFASYALDATSNGLGVNTNQRLWILRCSMDVQRVDKETGKAIAGEHFKEWADVLAKVERMVRIEASAEGRTMRSFNGNSLEMLAKNVVPENNGKITYIPSLSSRNGSDRKAFDLRRKDQSVFKRVANGEVNLADAMREAGVRNTTALQRAKYNVRNMTAKERREFIEWLKAEGYL